MISTRVVLADDHPMVRATIHNLLEKAAGIKIVGEATNGREALQLVEELQPDVLLLDMEMPDLKGFEIMQQLQAKGASVRILAFSAYNDKQYMLKMLDYGAAGYLSKDTSPQTIIEAIRYIARRPSQPKGETLPVTYFTTRPRAQLTDNEIEILRLVAGGKTVQQISLSLGLAEEVVTKTIKVIFSKLGVHTSIEAAGKAIQQGLI
jgi:NarL family two-component system response regulator YdfI